MKRIKIPAFLHEAFGESQTTFELTAIVAFATIATALIVGLAPEPFASAPIWRSTLALLLVFDIAAGCLANFTRSTNAFYAARPRARWIFIACHLHLPIITLLLNDSAIAGVLTWAYTVAGAAAVNLLKSSSLQPFTAGALLAGGFVAFPLFLPLPTYLLVVAHLFMLKVLYAFVVNHFPGQDMTDLHGRK